MFRRIIVFLALLLVIFFAWRWFDRSSADQFVERVRSCELQDLRSCFVSDHTQPDEMPEPNSDTNSGDITEIDISQDLSGDIDTEPDTWQDVESWEESIETGAVSDVERWNSEEFEELDVSDLGTETTPSKSTTWSSASQTQTEHTNHSKPSNPPSANSSSQLSQQDLDELRELWKIVR